MCGNVFPNNRKHFRISLPPDNFRLLLFRGQAECVVYLILVCFLCAVLPRSISFMRSSTFFFKWLNNRQNDRQLQSLIQVTYPVITFATDFATPRRIPLAKSTVCRCHMVQPKAKKAHIELFCTHTIKHFKTLFNSTERRSLIWLVRILAPKPRPFQHDKKISIAGGVVRTNNQQKNKKY